tara:strand:+ start:624 stop:911 length:288 start_codon:yes stop_codon:yes gene_type:complete
MTFWRKFYPYREADDAPWVDPSILLSHGTLLIWKCANVGSSDDWTYTHSVYPCKKGQPGYVDKPDEERERIVIVMRCTGEEGWYATDLPHRMVSE